MIISLTVDLKSARGSEGYTYVAHLPHDGLLLLAQIVLVVLWELLVQVLVHLQNLAGDIETSGGLFHSS